MAEPGFLRGREWLRKPKVQGRGKKRVKQMKRAWWSVEMGDLIVESDTAGKYESENN